MAMVNDPRGAPDYSHYDYAAENVRMYERGKADGEADKAAGKEPNHYLYVRASPDYSAAKGYREGFGLSDADTEKAHRIKCVRDQHGVGLIEAKRIVAKEMVLEEIDAAESVDDLKAILRQLVAHSW